MQELTAQAGVTGSLVLDLTVVTAASVLALALGAATLQRHTEFRVAGRRPGTSVTRTAILDAAKAAFAAQGYGATSVRGVARAAGVDPALVVGNCWQAA